MKGCMCPSCGADSMVVDSRANGAGIRRRRRCVSCDQRWSTQELPIELATGFAARDKIIAKAVKSMIAAYSEVADSSR